MHLTQQQILESFVYLQAKQVKEPSFAKEQVIMPASNADNLFVQVGDPVSTMVEPTTFMTRAEVEATLREKEKEKAFVIDVKIDRQPPLWQTRVIRI